MFLHGCGLYPVCYAGGDDKRIARLKDINSLYLENKTGAAGANKEEIDSNARLLASRAIGAANLDALAAVIDRLR